MLAGMDSTGTTVDLISVFEGVGQLTAGLIDQQRLDDIEVHACPTCGSCSGMFTANSMNCLGEALGIALPLNGTAVAKTPERMQLARDAAVAVMCMFNERTTFLDLGIVTARALSGEDLSRMGR